MKLILLTIAVSLLACGSEDRSTEANPPEQEIIKEQIARRLRGYEEINTQLRSYVFKNEDYDIAKYLHDEPNGLERFLNPITLSDMLGSSKDNGMKDVSTGSVPNGMNSLLWVVVSNAIASDLSSACKGNKLKARQEIELYPDMLDVMTSLCSEKDWTKSTLTPLYETIMAQHGRDNHMDLWSEFNVDYQSKQENKNREKSLIFSALFSPEFLTRR